MFKIGFRSHFYPNEIEFCKKHGIEVLELIWEEHIFHRKDEIRNLNKNGPVRITAITMGVDFDFEQSKDYIEFSASLGCPVLVGHPAPVSYEDPEGIRRFVGNWTQIAQYGKKNGVKMAVHSCGLDPVSWDIMLGNVPDLYLKYDPSFTVYAGRSYVEDLVKYGKKVVHVHIKDALCTGRSTDFGETGLLKHRYTPAGMGDIKWGQIMNMLYESDYQGDFAIETHSEFWGNNFEKDIILSKRHIEQFIV